jgi:Stress responsive A/B Barrel Domain
MIHHIVCFRFKSGTTPEQIARAGTALLGMYPRIPEIRGIRWGENFAPSAGEYSHVLSVILDDMAAVHRYLSHPVHVEVVAEALGPIHAARVALDIEMD